MRRRPGRLASLAVSLTLSASALQHSRPARLALAFTLLTRSASALHHAQRPRVLLVDCHDSYTHNVASWLHDVGATPEVVAADDVAFETALDKDAAALLRKYDALVLSPGPGHPAHVPRTLHQCLRHADDMPVLGVCLGHQFLALSEGGSVKRLQEAAARPCKQSRPHFFQTILAEQGFEATRYHSLTVDENSSANSDPDHGSQREGDARRRARLQTEVRRAVPSRVGRDAAGLFNSGELSRRRADGLEDGRLPSIQKHVSTPTSSFVTRATRLDLDGVDAAAAPCCYSRRTAWWTGERRLGDAGGPFGAVLTQNFLRGRYHAS